METIDSNLDLHSHTTSKRELNGYLLAAYLLVIFGINRFSSLYTDMYGHGETTPYINLAISCLFIAGTAWLSDMIGQTRILNIAGMGLLILLGIVTAWSDSLNGYPLAVLYNLSVGFITAPLLKRLLTNTVYFGSTQKTALIAKTAVIVLSTFIYRALLGFHAQQSDTGNTVIGCLLIAIALILVLVDKEPEPPIRTLQEYQNTATRPLSIVVFLLITLASLVTFWASAQANFINLDYNFRSENPDLITHFASMIMTMGVVALLIFALKVKNPFVYIGIGAGILALIICVFLTIEIKSDSRWFYVILTGIGVNLAELGILLWMCRYTDFPFLTLLLSMFFITEEISYFLIHAGLDLRTLFKVQHEFMNF